ncbi:hypothetical protein Lsan_4069 [Legionella santicrucis]|uniref:Uncharacterized protein n=1 Tax=Legionella santicrucis TaxID=45074 RepID=A0A0W0Y9M2_9GAMM|nr:hypothetical protein [Legionella santicrucis]KTD53659.1 hypothetical protein Lsan_4069 [Legionella santicrucis]
MEQQQNNFELHDLEAGRPQQENEQPGPDNVHPCRVKVSKSKYCGFFRTIQSVLVPQISAEISILEGDLDTAESELKLAKANYKRRYLYISGLVAATVGVLQLSKQQWAANDVNTSMAIDFTSAVVTIIGTAATSFVKSWDDTADDHLAEIAESRRTLAAYQSR